MLFKKKKSAVEKEIEAQIETMKLYLENNYKDLAIQGRKDAIKLVEDYHEQGSLTNEQYEHYKQILDDYTEMMQHYNHQEFYHF